MVLALLVFAGFARTYYLRAWFDVPPITMLLHLHSIAFTAWFVLFVIQTRLIAAQNYRTHMQLGVAGVVLAVIVTVLGYATAILSADAPRIRPMGMNSQQFVLVPLVGITFFAVFVACAVAFRRRADLHKRFMMLAMISVLGPPVARLIAVTQSGQYFGAIQTGGGRRVSALGSCQRLDEVPHRASGLLDRRHRPAHQPAGALPDRAHAGVGACRAVDGGDVNGVRPHFQEMGPDLAGTPDFTIAAAKPQFSAIFFDFQRPIPTLPPIRPLAVGRLTTADPRGLLKSGNGVSRRKFRCDFERNGVAPFTRSDSNPFSANEVVRCPPPPLPKNSIPTASTGPPASAPRRSCPCRARRWTRSAGIPATSSSSPAMPTWTTPASAWPSWGGCSRRRAFASASSRSPTGRAPSPSSS